MYDKEKITPQWLAGFFDGEGCVSVKILPSGYSSLQVAITQKNFDLIFLVDEMFPGHTWFDEGRGRISWNGDDSRRFLEYIRDFVVLKKDVVEFTLAYINSRDGNEKGRLAHLIKAEIKIKNARYDEMYRQKVFSELGLSKEQTLGLLESLKKQS